MNQAIDILQYATIIAGLAALWVWLKYDVRSNECLPAARQMERFFIPVSVYFDLLILFLLIFELQKYIPRVLAVYDVIVPLFSLLILLIKANTLLSRQLILVSITLPFPAMVLLSRTLIPNLYWPGSIASILITLILLVRHHRKIGFDFIQGLVISACIALGALNSHFEQTEVFRSFLPDVHILGMVLFILIILARINYIVRYAIHR